MPKRWRHGPEISFASDMFMKNDAIPDVPAAYDRIAERWRDDRLSSKTYFREKVFIDELVRPLRPGARILDCGCGFGRPIAEYLIGSGFDVTGLDASSRLLAFAEERLPGLKIIRGDMRTADVPGGYSAIVAWDSVFHLPRADHEPLFRRFHSWLVPSGRLLISLGGSGDEGFTSEMHGESFFYSGYEPEEALRNLERAGLRVIRWEVDDPGSRGHIAVLAERSGGDSASFK